jgi:hypothetical protein
MADKAEPKEESDPVATQPVPPQGAVEGIDPHLAAVLSPEALNHRKALAADWSEYVAVTDIPYGNVLAYRAGVPVPARNVKRWQFDQLGLVAKRSTKAGEAALAARAAESPSAVKAPGD